MRVLPTCAFNWIGKEKKGEEKIERKKAREAKLKLQVEGGGCGLGGIRDKRALLWSICVACREKRLCGVRVLFGASLKLT